MIDWEGLQSVIDWDEFPTGRSPVRRIRIICRHTCWNPSLPTHEFPEKVELAPFWVDGDRESFNDCKWSDITVREPGEKRWEFKCPRCRYHLRLVHRKMLILIRLLDDIEQQRTGRPRARVMRLDISSMDRLLL